MKNLRAAGLWLAVLMTAMTGPAAGAVIAQGYVDVTPSTGPQDIGVNGPGPLPASSAYYLTLDTGTLVDAGWVVDAVFFDNWWEYTYNPASPLFLNGESWPASAYAEGDGVQDLSFGPGPGFRITSAVRPGFAEVLINDIGRSFDVCANPYAVPVGQDCAQSGQIQDVILDAFLVQTTESFTWTLSDTRPAGIPEPGAWSTLSAGLLLAGSALRRRRARRRAAFAARTAD